MQTVRGFTHQQKECLKKLVLGPLTSTSDGGGIQFDISLGFDQFMRFADNRRLLAIEPFGGNWTSIVFTKISNCQKSRHADVSQNGMEATTHTHTHGSGSMFNVEYC